MKRILLLLSFLAAVAARGQVYNNEWIDYSKTYYKFHLGETGLYRIPQSLLNTQGLGSVNADHFQLWKNGQQVPIYTSVQNAPLGASDYIEFWGEMNDGRNENVLYRRPESQLNDKWSLTTDTSTYFLTVNPAGPNARLVTTANNVAGNTLSPEPFFMHTVGKYYKDRQNNGRSERIGSSYTFSSAYDVGEGWTTGDIASTGTVYLNLNNLFSYTGAGAPPATVKVNAAGNSSHERYFLVRLNNDSIMGPQMDYYDFAKASKDVPVSAIASNAIIISVTNRGATPDNFMVIGQTELVYPRLFNFGGVQNFTFELAANAAGNYLEIAGFITGGTPPTLYDLTNGKSYEGDISNPSLVKFALLPSATKRQLVLANKQAANIKTIASMQQRNFINYGLPANQGNYLIVTNQVLVGPQGGIDPISDYIAYRSSPQGGGYNTKMYLIDQLIDQFGFGLKMHPIAIRHFMRWARNTYSSPVKNLFLIGKGVVYPYIKIYENNPDLAKLALVPTFGTPASDNMLTSEGSSSQPLTPVGRLSVINRAEIAAYLEKVKQYELEQTRTSPLVADMGWKKNVVHVTGASDDATTNTLLLALNGHKTIIQDTLYGGRVATFTKKTSDAVEQIVSSQLASMFKEGVGLLTYFGHSSATTLEFNLDDPKAYANEGKYPIFIVMGCNAGGFYGFNIARLAVKETISERYVLTERSGSVAFLASTYLGIIHYLDIYNTRFYRTASITHYGATIGEQMDETIRKVLALGTEEDFYARFQCEQFTLHGDPALKLNNFPKPDFAIEDPMVKASPSFISVAEPEFKLNASFRNIGNAPNKNIVVELKRTYPDQTVAVIQRDTIRATRFIDSISYNIPINAVHDKGLNKLTITIDADNEVDEAYETNNSVTKDIYIFEDELRPTYPYDFSIVNQPTLKFVASTANAFAEMRNYMMEIDTTELFNSSLKVSATKSSKGGVIEFEPSVSFRDSTVYYWRVSPVVTTGEPHWNTSSFIYINSSETGFAQAHLYQHLKSKNDRIKLDSASHQWLFGNNHNYVFANNGVYPTTSGDGAFYTGTINDVRGFIGPGCGYNELIFTVINPVTFKAWKNEYAGGSGLYQSYAATCGSGREYNFEYFLTDSAWRRKMANFLDIIPDGYFVLVRSNSNPNPNTSTATYNTFSSVWKNDGLTWGAGNSIYDKFVAQGFEAIDSFNRPRSWAFMYKKNGSAEFTPRSSFSEGIYDAITINGEADSPDTLGFVRSPKFGPAKAWHRLKWKGRTIDSHDGDIPSVSLVGIASNGGETTLFTAIDVNTPELDISSVDPAQFPYLQLRMTNQDSINFTPYQLRYWMLTYDPVPEGAIAPNYYYSTKDTVDVGEPLNFGIAFKNISKVDFDSVVVKFVITDRNNVEHIVPVPKQKELRTQAPNDTIRLNVPIDTRSLSGLNSLFVNFNPDENQPEQYLFNNYAFKQFYVKPDSLNPLLDVTFDGVHILNHDIVSAKPAILIKLKDEARWMILDDPNLVNIDLRFPDGNIRRFNFNNNDTLQFIPPGQAPNEDNTASINFNPALLQDGEYELIVSGKDRSDNQAGAVQYRVIFQVVNKPMISNMLNYPNPFTTSTAFVFTLTGSEVPQNIRIQILTVTGKVVREITKDELGPLHIGRNITEFKWDGTDQYGQKLGNGVYLYRVITNLNGKSLDKYRAKDDNTDQYFNKGYGKMYLMR